MLFPHFEPPHLTKRVLVHKTVRYWRRTCAWIMAPILIGLAGVSMAKISHFAFDINTWIVSHFPWAAIFYMPAGFAFMIYLTRRFFPGIQGSGIPQVIAVIDDPGHKKKSNLLSVRIIIGKVITLVSGLIMGASIGHEGPMVQIGASIMHRFYGYGTIRTAEQRRMLVLSGGAAGIAATFNTPIAGIMFAMEELTKKYVFNAHSSTLLTVILSGFVSLAIVGNYTYFGYTNESLPFFTYIPAIVVCGLVGGISGGLFSLITQKFSAFLPKKIREGIQNHPYRFAALCGLIVAFLGLLTNGMVYGTGYLPTRLSLESDTALHAWYYGPAKFLATLLSALSAIPGGLFAPTLAVGAGIGDNLSALFPNLAPHSAIIILVMAAYLSGLTRSPLTSFIVTMEITGSHQMLLSLMTATLIASLVSRFVCPKPFYHALAERFELPAGPLKTAQTTSANAQNKKP